MVCVYVCECVCVRYMLCVWYMYLCGVCVWYVCVCVCLYVGCSHQKENNVSVLTDHSPHVLFHNLIHASEAGSAVHHRPYFWGYSHIAATITGFL